MSDHSDHPLVQKAVRQEELLKELQDWTGKLRWLVGFLFLLVGIQVGRLCWKLYCDHVEISRAEYVDLGRLKEREELSDEINTAMLDGWCSRREWEAIKAKSDHLELEWLREGLR